MQTKETSPSILRRKICTEVIRVIFFYPAVPDSKMAHSITFAGFPGDTPEIKGSQV